MQYGNFLCSITFFLFAMTQLTGQNFESYPTFKGDLGLNYTPQKSDFRIWAPSATKMVLRFYEDCLEGEAVQEIQMKKAEKGTWFHSVSEDLEGTYYTFQTKVDGQWRQEVPGPYAKAVGTNGQRGQVIDFEKTNPTDWDKEEKPKLENFTDIILWEIHMRDFSIHESSGIKNKGKFLAFTETGTIASTRQPISTGIDHLKELGITHVHLLPSYDYGSVDESRLEEAQFNWGYDPMNYNVPEGSYSSNPCDGASRIREFKQMVQSLHQNDLRVVMDVVYNHTFKTDGMCFQEIVPDYYYRQNEDGSLSNASGCGNEVASEREMVNKYIIESVKYWAEEYHIDGFRFDLMGIHDQKLMRDIRAELDKIDPTIFIYGEGWTAGGSPIPDEERCLKANTHQLEGIAAFSDDMRDGLKGSVFEHEEQGFVSGKKGMEESIKFGIVGATEHPQVDYEKVNYSNKSWAGEPTQCINYVSCHDNHTLWDRLQNSNPKNTEEEKIAMHKMAQAIILTSQGVPLLHAGTELLRTKEGEENSYKSPDTINQLDWTRKAKYASVFEYYKNLIELRKKHPAFRMPTNEMIQKHLHFIDDLPEGVIGYSLSENANGDSWKTIYVFFNPNNEQINVTVPKGNWKLVASPDEVNESGLLGWMGTEILELNKYGAFIFVK